MRCIASIGLLATKSAFVAILSPQNSTEPNPTEDISFDYHVEEDGERLDGFTIAYADRPESRSGRHYPAGTYDFSDPEFIDSANGIPVWQYYVLNPVGDPGSKTFELVSDDGEFTPFTTPKFTMKEGTRIIWRCVLIFTRPTLASPTLASTSAELKASSKM